MGARLRESGLRESESVCESPFSSKVRKEAKNFLSRSTYDDDDEDDNNDDDDDDDDDDCGCRYKVVPSSG